VTALRRLAPENAGWIHDTEGPDDMPAHVKAALTGVSLHIPVVKGGWRLASGRGYISSSTARSCIGARSCCNSSAVARRADSPLSIAHKSDRAQKLYCR